jgi:hypothetical protein
VLVDHQPRPPGGYVISDLTRHMRQEVFDAGSWVSRCGPTAVTQHGSATHAEELGQIRDRPFGRLSTYVGQVVGTIHVTNHSSQPNSRWPRAISDRISWLGAWCMQLSLPHTQPHAGAAAVNHSAHCNLAAELA